MPAGDASPFDRDPSVGRVVVSEDELSDRIAALGKEITADYHGRAPLLVALAADLDPTDARALAAAPPPLARRAIRSWLMNGYRPDSATVERVLDVARGRSRATDVGGGRRVARSGGRLYLSEHGG